MVEAVSAGADRSSFWGFYESGADRVFCEFVYAARREQYGVEDWVRVSTDLPAASRMSVTPAIDPSLRTATVPWPPFWYRRGYRWSADSLMALFALLPGTLEFSSFPFEIFKNSNFYTSFMRHAFLSRSAVYFIWK